MIDHRIPTELWVSAKLRSLQTQGIGVYVVHSGAPASGTVIIRSVLRDESCLIYTQTRDLDGNLVWMDSFDGKPADKVKGDDYIQRARNRDPDVWIIEIEDKNGKNLFE
jgi:hypothetical protein